MTKKVYESTAKILLETKPKIEKVLNITEMIERQEQFNGKYQEWVEIVSAFAVLYRINPKFSVLKFKNACGYDEEE
jgi:hypothetical protein